MKKDLLNKEYKSDCFAFVGEHKNFCRALNTTIVKDCTSCEFYRNDISHNQIEKDIVNYKIIKK